MFSIVAKVYNQVRKQVGWVVVDERGNLTAINAEQARVLHQNKKIDENCPFNGSCITSNSYNMNMFQVYLDWTPLTNVNTLFIVNALCKGQGAKQELVGYTVLRLLKDGLKVAKYRLSDMQTLKNASYTALNGRMLDGGKVAPRVGSFPVINMSYEKAEKKSTQKKSIESMTKEDWKKYCEFYGDSLERWTWNGAKAIVPPFITYVSDTAFDNCKYCTA